MLILNKYNFLFDYNIMPRKSKTKSNRSKSYLRKTKNKSRRNKTRQRKYYMIGCDSKKCRCSCHRRKGGSSPIGGLEIKNGGGCFGPLVGSSYSVDKGGNYYNLPKAEAYSVDRTMELKGGSLLPPNLLNFTRQIEYGAQSLYNGLGGYEAPTDPAPYVQKNI
jgi:hypothetical protein